MTAGPADDRGRERADSTGPRSEDPKAYARERERPKPEDRGQAGFMGKAGHGAPTPPGGKHPGGEPSGQAPELPRDDDDPIDPRTSDRDAAAHPRRK